MTHEQLIQKTLKYGYQDPGAYLADNCSLWSWPIYLLIAASIGVHSALWLGVILCVASLFFTCARLNAYNMGQQGVILIMIISITIGAFSTPFIILKRIGINR